MFNFDMFGMANYKITGLVRVSVSDAFSYSDYLSTSYSNFYSALYTSGSDEVPWTPDMLDGLKSVLASYSQFINLQFDWKGDYEFIGSDASANPEDVGRAAVSDINISWLRRTDSLFSGISGGSGDQFPYGYTGAAGDIFLNNAYLPFNLDWNSTSLQTLIHELGHSLGLSHPHSDYNYTTNQPTISTDYAATQYLGFQKLGFSINSAADMYKEYFTVMTYDDQISTLPNSNYVFRTYTPMILDVIALQQTYGEGPGTSGSGNDTINAGTVGYRTYFDTGGIDTVDLTFYTEAAYLHMGVSITGAAHLVGVAMSKFDALNTIVSGGNPANLRWLYGEYENAIGSSADDFITGNSLANKIDGRGAGDFLFGEGGNDDISGGDGDDIMYGGDGDDRFDWDSSQRFGADTMYGGLGNDTFVLDSINDKVVEAGNEGVDTVIVGFNYSIANTAIENLSTFSSQTASLIFTGSDWGNIIATGAGSDTLLGLEGDDTLIGLAGNDTIDGGTGADTARYSTNTSNYTITKTTVSGTTTYTVRDKTGADGTDTLTNLEALKFSDKTINLTIQAQAKAAPAADVTRLSELYVAFFNRIPDADGLSYWIGQKVAGQSINQIADSFYNAGVQFSSLTGFTATMSNADFVNVIYRNVLGRKDGADAGGLAYWTGKLADGSATRGALVSTILDSAHTYKGDATYGYVADLLDNKILVAKTFAIDLGLNYNSSNDSITNGMAIAAAVTPTSTAAAISLIGVSAADVQLS